MKRILIIALSIMLIASMFVACDANGAASNRSDSNTTSGSFKVPESFTKDWTEYYNPTTDATGSVSFGTDDFNTLKRMVNSVMNSSNRHQQRNQQVHLNGSRLLDDGNDSIGFTLEEAFYLLVENDELTANMQGTVKKTESGKKCFLECNSYNNHEYIKVSIDNVYLAEIRPGSGYYIGNSTTPATGEDLTAFFEKNEFFSAVLWILDGRFDLQSGEIKTILTDIFTDKETNDYLSVTQSSKKSDVKDDIKVLKLKGKVGNNDFELRMKTDNSNLVNSYISFYQNLDSFNWYNWDFLEVRINNTVYSLESVAALLKSN